MSLTRRQFTKRTLLAGGTGLFAAPAIDLCAATRIHTVKRGDTLGEIAEQYGISTAEIRQQNQLTGDLIRIGQKLEIKHAGKAPTAPEIGMRQHVVKAGDTLGAIARSHGISLQQLKEANQLDNDVIRIGEKLKIPTIRVDTGVDFLREVRAETAKINVREANWKRIVVHHSGIKYGNAAKYDAAHRRRGMQNGMAYHFLIGNGIDSGDGEIEIGPRWKSQLLGGHVKSYRINLTAIGICLVGNFEESFPSRRQLDAFTQLMDWLKGEVLPRAERFAGHRELRGEQTVCPGKHFPLAAMHDRYGS